jgi:hypothetical protein
MNIVSKSQLRITIYNIIYEAMQKRFYEEESTVITKTDVINFIESNPYFDEMFKVFLKDKFIEDVDAIMVTEEWKEEFVKRVRRWVENYNS